MKGTPGKPTYIPGYKSPIYTLVPFSTIPTEKCNFISASAKINKFPNQFSPSISSKIKIKKNFKNGFQIITLGPHKWYKTKPTPHGKATGNWLTFAFVIPIGSLHGVVNCLKNKSMFCYFSMIITDFLDFFYIFFVTSHFYKATVLSVTFQSISQLLLHNFLLCFEVLPNQIYIIASFVHQLICSFIYINNGFTVRRTQL